MSARSFARKVSVGDTWYSVVENMAAPGIPPKSLKVWTFDRPHPRTGEPMCGNMTAKQVYNAAGGKLTRTVPNLETAETMSKKNNATDFVIPEGYEPPSGWTFRSGPD